MESIKLEISRTQFEILAQPIFIVGPLRSGTTLLRLLLDHHPDINIFGEFEFSVSQAVGDKWPEMSDFHNFLDGDRVVRQLKMVVDHNLGYKELQHDFLRQMHDREPTRFIGATVHSRMDLLPNLWPEARYIHLMRDPRDVARSCIGMGWVGNVYYGGQYWLEAEAIRQRLKEKVDDDNMIDVYFEDLVGDSESTLMRICQFIGVPYQKEMLNIEKDTSYQPPDAGLAYQWKRKLTSRELSWVETQCGEVMKSQGYKPCQKCGRRLHWPERTYLFIQHKIYRMTFNIHRWGFMLWFIDQLAGRFGIRYLQRWAKFRISQIDAKYIL